MPYDRVYVLLVTPGYEGFAGGMPKLVGPIGPVPDDAYQTRSIISAYHRLSHYSGNFIPEYLKRMKFILSQERHYRSRQIYVYFDFWLIGDAHKAILEKAAGASFEFAPAQTFEDAVTPTKDKFWLAKVTRKIDCIDAKNSFFRNPQNGGEIAFSELALEIELTNDLAPRFANHGPTTYRSYPTYPARLPNLVTLFQDRIPSNCEIFTPVSWPGHIICTKEFYDRTIIRDKGYSIWSLPLHDTAKAYEKELFSMR